MTIVKRYGACGLVAAIVVLLLVAQLVSSLAPRPALDRAALLPVTDTADAQAAEAAWRAANPDPVEEALDAH